MLGTPLLALGLVASTALGGELARRAAAHAHRRDVERLTRLLGTPEEPLRARPCVTLVGTLAGLGADDPSPGAVAMTYVLHGSLADDPRVPPARSTSTYAKLGVRVGGATVLLSGNLHLVEGSSSASGDRASIVESDPSLHPPTNWDSVAVRTLRIGDRVRARGRLDVRASPAGRELLLGPAPFEGGDVVALAYEPSPPGAIVAALGAIAGALAWTLAALR